MSLDQFKRKFKVEVNRLTAEDMEFDLIGCDASLANAFRRILISEVPTVAIDKVFIANNTSVIPDKVLSHRLSLIPIQVDPRLFDYLSDKDTHNGKNTVVFKLHLKCTKAYLARGQDTSQQSRVYEYQLNLTKWSGCPMEVNSYNFTISPLFVPPQNNRHILHSCVTKALCLAFLVAKLN